MLDSLLYVILKGKCHKNRSTNIQNGNESRNEKSLDKNGQIIVQVQKTYSTLQQLMITSSNHYQTKLSQLKNKGPNSHEISHKKILGKGFLKKIKCRSFKNFIKIFTLEIAFLVRDRGHPVTVPSPSFRTP